MCSHLCKCVGCKNFEESPTKKTLMHLADAAEVRKQQQVSARSQLSSHTATAGAGDGLASSSSTSRATAHAPGGKRLAYSYMTQAVAEATCSCLVAQAEETERTRQIDTIQEQRVLEEFGRCMMQVIECANRTGAPRVKTSSVVCACWCVLSGTRILHLWSERSHVYVYCRYLCCLRMIVCLALQSRVHDSERDELS